MYIYIPDQIILPTHHFIILVAFAMFGVGAFFIWIAKYNMREARLKREGEDKCQITTKPANQ